MTIWKYEFEIADEVKISMPLGAEILSVGTQRRGFICVWALLDPNASTITRLFRVFGTGHPFDVVMYKFWGTVTEDYNGVPAAWHIFEV